MIAVLVVDDHAAILKALQCAIERSNDIKVLAMAASGEEAIACVGSHCPDVIVMDISMPQMDGIEVTRQILVRCPLSRILMLSTYDGPSFIRRAVEAGARGHILKDLMGDDLLVAIRTVSKGDYYFSQKIAKVAEKYLP